MARKIPKFDDLLRNFPKLASDQVKKLIGGDVDADHYKNACVMRVSRSLNYAGDPVPQRAHGMIVKRGADKLWYGIRVVELRKYLTYAYGRPHVSKKLGHRDAKAPEPFRGYRGILLFEGGLVGATGHATLWDGFRCADHCYFEASDEAHLWIEDDGKGGRWSEAEV